MNKVIKTIPIQEEEAFLLERYYFEYTGLKAIIEQFTLQSDYVLSEEKYMKLIEQYIEAYAQYNLVWNHLRIKYLQDYKGYDSIADFNIPAIEVIESNGGCSSCSIH